MKSADKRTQASIIEHYDAREAAGSALEDARLAFNTAIGEAYAELARATSVFNEVQDAYKEQVEDLISQIDSYVEERSDRWRKTDAASHYDAWRAALLESIGKNEEDPDDPSFEDVSVYLPETMPDLDLSAYA